jgi:hypothetical protein
MERLHLFATYVTGDAFRWDIRLATWRRKACEVAAANRSHQDV